MLSFERDPGFEGVVVTIPSDSECEQLRDEIEILKEFIEEEGLALPKTPLLDKLYDNLPG